MSKLDIVSTPFFCVFMLAVISAQGQNVSTGTQWTNPAHWSLNHIPLATEDVTINSNMVLNTNATVRSLLVNNNRTLTIGNNTTSRTLAVTNNVTVTGGNGAIRVGAFNAVHDLTIGGTLSNGGIFSMVTAANQLCNVTLNGTSITGNGTYLFDDITIGGSITNNSTSAIDVVGTMTVNDTFTCTAGTIDFIGAGTQSLTGTTNPTFNNVTSGANNVLTMSGITGATINGTYTMTAPSTFDFGTGAARTLTVAGNFTPRTIIMTGAGLAHDLILRGATNSQPTAFTTTAGSGSTVEYAGTAQGVIFTLNYQNLILSGSGVKTFNGITTVNGDLSISGSANTVSNAFALSVAGNINNNGAGITTWGSGTANVLTLAGNLNVTNNTTFTIGSSGGAAKTLNIAGDVNLASGSTINAGNTAANAMTISGNLQLDGTFNLIQNVTLNNTITVGTGTLNGSTTSNLSIGGNNTNEMFLPAIGGGNLLNLTLNKTGTTNSVNLGGPLTLQAAGVLTLTAGVLEIGNYNLTFLNTAAAAVAGAPYSASKMIATDGTGYLIRPVIASPGLSPIGAGGYYSPINISSLTTGGTYSIRAVPNALNPNYINVYWDLLTSASGKTMTATFQYDPAQLNGATQIISYTPVPYTSVQRPPSSGTSSFGANSFTITGNVSATNGGYWSMGSGGTYYSYQTGDWNTPTTWTSDPSGSTQVGSTIPGFNDNIVILSGRTVTLTSNITALSQSVNIESGGFLDMSTYSFTNGLLALGGEGTLRLASVNFPTAATNTLINAGGGTVEYYNAASFTLPVTQTTYNHLTINSSGQVATQLMNLTLNGNLLVSSGTFRINDATSTRRQLTVAGNVTVNSGAAIAVGTGVTNGTTNPLAIATTVAGPFIEYYDSHSHRIVINGDFVNNGTVNFSNLPYPVYNAFPPTATGATTGFATVYFRGASNNLLTCNGTTNFYNLVLDKGTDQTYSLTVNSSAYSNFRLYGANTAAADNSAGATATNPNVKKALWIRNGTLVLQGSTIIPSLSEGNTTAALPATSDYLIPANGALHINGPDVVLLSTADVYQEVNVAYGVSGGAGAVNGVIEGGYSSLYVFGRLQVSDGYLSTRESGGIVTNGGSGQIIFSNGDVDVKQFLNATGSTASFQMSGGTFAVRGRFRRTPVSYATVADLTDNTTATLNTTRADNGITPGAGAFNINNASNIFNMSAGDIVVYDVADPATQFAFDVKSGASNISVTGGTITVAPRTGSGTDATNFLVSSTAALGNLIVNRASSTSVVRLNTAFPLTVLSNLDIQSGTFDANAQNVTIGGNFTIASTGSYLATGAAANTTIFNGSSVQAITVNTAAALDLNNLTLTKAAGVHVNLAGSQSSINVAGALNLTLGTLNDNGKSVFVRGNVFNSGVHTGAGKISLDGTTVQSIDGNGTFQNLELNNATAVAAPVTLVNNITINGALTLSQNKLFNIGTYNLRFNGTASVINAGPNRYIQTAGAYGDGGITKVYSSPAAFVFPLGAASTSRVGTPAYTPASLGLSAAPTTYGSITVVPVGYAHPNVTTAGRSLTYFWRVRSAGFVLGTATVTQGYTYSPSDVVTSADVTENGYVAARYDVNSATWTKGTTSDLDISAGAKVIGEPTPGSFLQNVGFIDGDYTAGDDTPTNPFGTPKVFYSYASGIWGSAANWTGDPTRATYINIGFPGAADVVHIGAGHTISASTPASYLTTPNTNILNCATLYIDVNSVLDVRYNPASNLGIVMNSPLGNGKIRITCSYNSGSTFANPAGDFSAFNTNLGTTELYSTNPTIGTTYWMANGVSTYGNLLFSPLGGSNIIFPNNDVLIYGDCIETGANADSWLCPAWDTAYPLAPTVVAPKTITINGNLDIQGGSFGWWGNGAVAQNVVVNGNISVCATCGLGVFGNATNQTLTIGGSLTNNSSATTNGVVGVTLTAAPVTFNGNNPASITNTGGTPTTTFGRVTVNKGTSQATTLNINIGGTLTTLTDNWLTLQNGTLQYQRTNPSTSFNISTVTNLNIPSTAGLYINYANGNNTNIIISNSNTDAADLLLSGKLTVMSGNVYVGPTNSPAANNDIEYSGNTAAIQVNGGNLYVNGQIRRSTASTNGALSYTQTNGSVAINGNSSAGGLATALTRAKLEVLNTGSQFNMSGGTITLARGSGSTFGDLYIRPSTSTVTGGTILFTNTAPNSVQTYMMDATVPLYNLTVTGAAAQNATVSLMTNPLTLNGSLTLTNARSFFNANSRNVTINQNLVNNGTTAGYAYGTNTTTFSGGTQNISGSAVTNFYDLVVAPSLSLTVNNNFTVNRNLTISSGSLLLSTYRVQVLTNGSFVNNGAYSDNGTTGGVSLSGSSQQEVSGTGSFQRLEINNTAGALLLNDITLDHNLVMTNGIFAIGSNNLILNTTALITGAPYSATKMITTDGVATSKGITKFFPSISSTTTFTYPVGVGSKYTPALYTINANAAIGYIKVAPVNAYQPTVLDPTRVLDYYFSIASSGITGFAGSVVLNYAATDVHGTESDYVAGWLQLPGTYWSKAAVGPATDNVNETTHQITFPYPAGSSNLNGDYTAGEDDAIPNQIPTYISNSNGNWSDNTIWTPVGTSPPCPVGGPNGYNVIIQHNVSTTVNNCFAYSTVIQSTGTLSILSPTFGHNFGTIDGDPTLGTGTLYLQGSNLPAGNFTPFLDCTGNGTIEYGGTGTYTIVLNGFNTIPNLTLSGTGTRVFPNDDLTICNVLKIDGPAFNNSVYNRRLTINGSMERYNTGAFVSGTGANATVSFAGPSAQTIGGAIGNFSGANAFYNLEINNPSGLSIGTGGIVEVNGVLSLTDGIVTTSASNTLSILNTSSSAVVPAGGSTTSFINGPLKKQMVNGGTFVYPLGAGMVKGHTFILTSTSAGSTLFTAQYFTPNPTSASVTAPIVDVNGEEYWGVSSTTTKTARVNIAWDSQSDINGAMTQNGISDLRVVEYSGTSWVSRPSSASGTPTLGSVQTTTNVSINTTPKNYTIGSITTTKPIAVLSPSGAVCGPAGIPVRFTTHSPITLNYTISYNWNGVPQTPIVVTSLPFILPTPAPGTYELTGFLYNNSTVAGVVDGTVITANASPTTANAGADQSICNATSLNLAGNNPSVGTGLWTIVSGTGGWFNTPDASNYNALFGGPPGRTYTLRWTITNGACTSSDNVVISFPYTPEQPSGFTSAPTSVCKGSTGNIYSVPAVTGATSYVWSYSGTGATFVGAGNSVTVNFSASATNGTVSVSAVNGCGTGTARSVNVTTVTPAVATFSYAGSPYCPSASNPSPTYSGGGVAGTFSSTTGLVFVSTSTGQVNLSASTPGTYTVTNTIPAASPCGPIIATATITIQQVGTWVGGISSNWLDANNWVCTTIPTTSTDVVVPAGATNMPVVNAGGAVCRNLTINSGASLTINTTNTLNVYGGWTNNGTFTRNNSTVIFNGAGTLGGASTTTFNNITIAAAGNVNGGSINVEVAGNWTNNGAFAGATGTITFTGTVANNITGTTSFNNITMSKTGANSTLIGTATTNVSGVLTLTNGHLAASATHRVAMSATASVSGGSASSFVSGPMTKVLTGSVFTFPLGSISANLYRPATIQNPSGADTWSAEYIGADPSTGGYSHDTYNVANIRKVSMFEYWLISRLASTSADLTLSYGLGSYIPPNIGTMSDLRVVRWNGSGWDLPPGAASFTQSGTVTAGTSTVTNVTSFSPFTHGAIVPNSPLPVQLAYFSAKVSGEAVLTEWRTVQEKDNEFFTVEKSADGETFKEATRVNTLGNDDLGHKYTWRDTEPYRGLSYYRLKQTDVNGSSTYFKVVAVEFDGTHVISFNTFPNPFDGKKITVEIKGLNANMTVPIEVHDLMGRVMLSKTTTSNQSGVVREDLVFNTALPAGVYFIRSGPSLRFTKKIEVN